MSGFGSADLLGRMVADDPKLESRRMLLDYTFRINRAYSAIYVVGACVAIMLWSWSMLRPRPFAPGLGIYGLVLGPLILAALFSGHLPLNVHGFGLVIFAQAVWFILAGILLTQSTDTSLDLPPALD